jgi:hypothetical protein
MIHPFTPDLSALSDKELEEKIQELTKKYFQSTRFSPSISGQIVLLLDSYKAEVQERAITRSKKSEELGENDINELIKID